MGDQSNFPRLSNMVPSLKQWSRVRRIRRRLPSSIDFGDLRRTGPISRKFGFDRGTPVDRYYIEQFLSENAELITGNVLEIADSSYTRKFGVDVQNSEVLHVEQGNPSATIVGDMSLASTLPDSTFDCIVCTQTLQFIVDTRAAIENLHVSLRTNGALLVTVPGISQLSRYDMDKWGDYWRFTSLSLRHFFERVFDETSIQVKTYGNVLAAVAHLHGICLEELSVNELDLVDPDYEVIVAARAYKL